MKKKDVYMDDRKRKEKGEIFYSPYSINLTSKIGK